MRIAEVIERLTAECPVLRLVGGAASLERATAGLATMPAAFVLPVKETAAESPFMDTLTQQEIVQTFVVVMAVRNLADDEGAAVVGSLWDVRESVRDALLGWRPTSAEANVEFVAGEVSSFENGVIWWEDSYRTLSFYRSA